MSPALRPAEPVPGGRELDPQWAWAPYRPDAQRPWNLARAGHLFRRAGFGASWPELEQAVAEGPQRTVDRLLEPNADVDGFNEEYDDYEASASGSIGELRAWWLRRMILTPHPLLEKMTLFWHNHFATSNARVNNSLLMGDHVRLLRRHALGHFGPLLEAVSRDPATLLALGAQANRKAMPNESFARQLLERFALGPGQFGDEDVQDVARAFTGWFVFRGRLRFIDREHDTGTKRILGQEGNWDSRDVVRIVLKPPAAGQLLVGKLYRWFVDETEEPPQPLLAPLVESFTRDYDLAAVVETILRSNRFFSPAAYRRRVKSPVEFALGIIRALEGMVPTARLGGDLADLGQNLYHPPTVHGWEGGRWWLNSASVLGRHKLARALLGGPGPYQGKLDPAAVAGQYGKSTPETAARFLLDLFLQGDLAENVQQRILQSVPTAPGEPAGRIRQVAYAVLTLPEFQLA